MSRERDEQRSVPQEGPGWGKPGWEQTLLQQRSPEHFVFLPGFPIQTPEVVTAGSGSGEEVAPGQSGVWWGQRTPA